MPDRTPVYRPILLTKDGELKAVRDLADDVLPFFAPIFVAQPVRIADGRATKSLETHIDDLARKVATTFSGTLAYLDTSFVDGGHNGESGPHPLIRASERIEASSGVQLVPVVAGSRGLSQVAAARELHGRDGRGVCIRLPAHNRAAMIEAADELPPLLDDLRAAPEEIDVVLDMAAGIDVDLATDLVMATVSGEDDEFRWRSVTLAASSFPKDLTGMPKNEITRLPRDDWRLWEDVATRMRSVGLEPPDYGDYGIAGPEPATGVDGRYMSISAAIRYAVDDDWLVAKGELYSGRGARGGEAVPPVARMLTEHPEFYGRDYSAGNRWISDVAAKAISPGNATTWRFAGTNHHITVVTRAIASLDGP